MSAGSSRRRVELKFLVSGDGCFEIGELISGNIPGNVLTLFVALVIVVRSFGTVADHADRTALHLLNLGDGLEERFGSRFGVH